MNIHKECIAMLLAGGQGSRLLVLTEKTAKPAVPFGGKYRIIDFPISNCVHSGIDTVGILTQYQPLELNDYIGNGQPWGLNRNRGGVHVLPPYAQIDKSEWYSGTANAIYQNIPFIERYNPEHVLILSGDHIYKMDYSLMLDAHKQNNAECTIAVRNVPIDEASRFGIMTVDPDGRITKFEEKPKKPESTLASMGVYIFKWDALRRYLCEDEANPESQNDFGKNIIPAMLGDQRPLYAYHFDSYWKDVGTIESLWEANMDLLNLTDAIDLRDPDFRIYSRNEAYPSSYISAESSIVNSNISEGCDIYGHVENSIISTGCTVEAGAMIDNSVLMPGAKVCAGAHVSYAIIGEGAVVAKNSSVGEAPEIHGDGWGIAVLGREKTTEAGEKLPAAFVR